MNIVILMAGRGTRFKDLHPELPKPLIPLHGKMLIEWVVRNLDFKKKHRYIFVCLKEHVDKHNLNDVFSTWGITYTIVEIDEVTDGAARSALMAKDLLGDEELIIANSDQLAIFDHEAFLQKSQKYDGCILSMEANGPKWSYIQTDENDLVTYVKEKDPISSTGTVGIYYFKKASSFVTAVTDMIKADDRHNQEFYLAPSYNYLIKNGGKVGHFNVGAVDDAMVGLGTSEDFIRFEKTPRSLILKKELFE